jgi:hypothetical protein
MITVNSKPSPILEVNNQNTLNHLKSITLRQMLVFFEDIYGSCERGTRFFGLSVENDADGAVYFENFSRKQI